jgi:hypothetical protein
MSLENVTRPVRKMMGQIKSIWVRWVWGGRVRLPAMKVGSGQKTLGSGQEAAGSSQLSRWNGPGGSLGSGQVHLICHGSRVRSKTLGSGEKAVGSSSHGMGQVGL